MKYGGFDLDWVVDRDKLVTGSGERTIFDDFKTVYNTSLKDTYIKGILDDFTTTFSLLSYFRQHLHDNLYDKLNYPNAPSENGTTINIKNESQMVSSVVDYIKSKAPAVMVLSGTRGDAIPG